MDRSETIEIFKLKIIILRNSKKGRSTEHFFKQQLKQQNHHHQQQQQQNATIIPIELAIKHDMPTFRAPFNDFYWNY
jgi:hypothetical protein